MGDTRKIFVSNIRPSTSLTRRARVLVGCKPITYKINIAMCLRWSRATASERALVRANWS